MSIRRAIDAVGSWIVWALAVAASIVAWRGGGLETVELRVYDLWARRVWQAPWPHEPQVVLVEIDEAYLDAPPAKPAITDDDLASLIQLARDHKASVIGVDLIRNFTMEPGSQRLTEVLSKARNVVGVAEGVPEAGLAKVGRPGLDRRVALANMFNDGDGVVRRGAMSARYGQEHPTLSYMLAAYHLAKAGITLGAPPEGAGVQVGEVVFPLVPQDFGGYVPVGRTLDTDADGQTDSVQFMIRYRDTVTRVSALTLLRDPTQGAALAGKAVIIGYTGVSKKDTLATPVDPMLNAPLVHGMIAAQLIDAGLHGEAPLGAWPERAEWCLLLMSGVAGAGLAYGLRSPWLLLPAGMAAVAGLGLLAAWQYHAGWWLPIVPSWLALVLSGVSVTAWLRYRERKDRVVLMGLFGRHVSDEVARTLWRQREQILSQGRLNSQNLTVSILFTDLQGFTGVSEQLGPEPTMQWLNRYLDRMGSLVKSHGGMVNKYMGDAIMAVFGAPLRRAEADGTGRDARAAVSCALAMRRELAGLNRELEEIGLPMITLRVGVFTGPVVAGSVGGADRLEYTVIGDPVNVASRLENYNKQLLGEFAPGRCRILIGEETLAQLDDGYITRFVAEDKVHNRASAVRIHAVLDPPPVSKG